MKNAVDPARTDGVAAKNVITPRSAELIQRLLVRVEDGTLRPSVSQTFELESIDRAFAALSAGPLGKVVLGIS